MGLFNSKIDRTFAGKVLLLMIDTLYMIISDSSYVLDFLTVSLSCYAVCYQSASFRTLIRIKMRLTPKYLSFKSGVSYGLFGLGFRPQPLTLSDHL